MAADRFSTTESAPWAPEASEVHLPDRGTLVVRDSGPQRAGGGALHGPPLLLLHGWGVTADLNFFPAYPALADEHRILAMDHRGHGRGLAHRGPYSLEACADDAAATLDALDAGPAVVVGYSMGGAVAQLLWRRHRHLVAGLVLCSTARHFRGGRTSDLWYAAYGPLGRAAAAAAGPAGALLRARVRRRVAGDPRRDWMADELLRADPAALLGALDAIGRFRSSPWLGSIDVPTAVLVTTRDRTVPPDRQRQLVAAISGAVAVEVHGPHDAIVTRSGAYVLALIDLCGRVSEQAVERGARG